MASFLEVPKTITGGLIVYRESDIWVFDDSPVGQFVVGAGVLPGDVMAAQFEARKQFTGMSVGTPPYARGIGMLVGTQYNYLDMQHFELPIAVPPHYDTDSARTGFLGILHIAADLLPQDFRGGIVVRSEFDVICNTMRELGGNFADRRFFMSVEKLNDSLDRKFPFLLRRSRHHIAEEKKTETK